MNLSSLANGRSTFLLQLKNLSNKNKTLINHIQKRKKKIEKGEFIQQLRTALNFNLTKTYINNGT